jgi:hypothetical protein
MKKLVFLFLVACASMMAQRTNPPVPQPGTNNTGGFSEKTSIITANYGFPNLYKSILQSGADVLNSYGAHFTVFGSGPYFLKWEYGVSDHVGIGAVFAYYNAGISQTSEYSYQQNNGNGNYTTITYKQEFITEVQSPSLGLRFNYHFGNNPKVDPYIGFAAGYSHITASYSIKSSDPNHTTNFSGTTVNPIPLYIGFTGGLRYYFTKNFGANCEFGIDKWAVVQLGVTYRF